MSQLDKLESNLDETLNKKAPFKISSGGRALLAGHLWWIVLIFGVLQLWVAWDMWRVGRAVQTLLDYTYDGLKLGQELGFLYYLSLLVAMVTAVAMLLAVPGLKAMRKAGWNLLFYALLLNVGYGIVRMFAYGGGFGDLLWAALSSLVGLYLLFQVRERFTMAKPADRK